EVLAGDDAIRLVGPRELELRPHALVHRGELGQVEDPGGHERLAALAEDEEHPAAALLGDQAAPEELLFGPDDVVDRALAFLDLAQRLLQRRLLQRQLPVLLGEPDVLLLERVDLLGQHGDGLLLVLDGGLEPLDRLPEFGETGLGGLRLAGERPDPLFALREALLALLEPSRELLDVLEEVLPRDGDGRGLLPADGGGAGRLDAGDFSGDVAHEPGVLRHLEQEAVLLGGHGFELSELLPHVGRRAAGRQEAGQDREPENAGEPNGALHGLRPFINGVRTEAAETARQPGLSRWGVPGALRKACASALGRSSAGPVLDSAASACYVARRSPTLAGDGHDAWRAGPFLPIHGASVARRRAAGGVRRRRVRRAAGGRRGAAAPEGSGRCCGAGACGAAPGQHVRPPHRGALRARRLLRHGQPDLERGVVPARRAGPAG